MSAISHRPYAGLSDLYAMKDTLTANWRAGYASYHPGDLDWWLLPEELGVSPEEMIEIWFTAKGNCLGWVVFLEARAEYDVVMHPDWRGSALERELLRWADARLTAAARQHGKTRVRALRCRKMRVCAFVFADNRFQRAVLREMDYAEADDVILYSQPLPPQPLPPIALTDRLSLVAADARGMGRRPRRRSCRCLPPLENFACRLPTLHAQRARL